jgi:hypothetical protein
MLRLASRVEMAATSFAADTRFISVVNCHWENDALLHIQVASLCPRDHYCQQQQQQQQHQQYQHQQQQQQQELEEEKQQQQRFSSLTTPHHSPLVHHMPPPSVISAIIRPFSPSLATTRHGTIDSPGGSWYVGEVRNSRSHGKGTRIFPDCSRYEGEWREGVSRLQSIWQRYEAHKIQSHVVRHMVRVTLPAVETWVRK